MKIPIRWKIITAIMPVILFVWLFTWLCPLAKASPPHPRTHDRWYTRPNQTVVLVFIRHGVVERWLYQMVHEAEPARDCTHSYTGMENGNETFTLVTYDMTHPYRYTMYSKPIMRWDSVRHEFVGLR